MIKAIKTKKTKNDLACWDKVEEFYEQSFGIPKAVVNYLAVYEMLSYCCSGMSNVEISEAENLETEQVEEIILEFLNFSGWEHSLHINPYFIYNKVEGNMDLYYSAVMSIPDAIEKNHIELSYNICKKLEEMEREIDKYYG